MGQTHKTSDASIVEVFVYKLGQVLGGRREVIVAPARELLKYLDNKFIEEEREIEAEHRKVFLNFLSMIYSQPAREGEKAQFAQARQRFIDEFSPKQNKEVKPVVFEWDEELMKRELEMQQRGG